ncbi:MULTISPECIES: hypothetical protein [unclassified Agrococcus]|uniref:hypothetical protein n=1 Tax=unclassified Agrococcus TaxID=2615065 RepID=UPI0036183F7E
MLALVGCANPPPYDQPRWRDAAQQALVDADALHDRYVPDDLEVLATARVDRCADYFRATQLFEPHHLEPGCNVYDVTVIALDPSDPDAALALTHDRLLATGLNPFLETYSGTILLPVPGATLASRLVESSSNIWSVRWDALDNTGRDARLLGAWGDALVAVDLRESPVVDCDCVQWWLIIETPYTAHA